MDPAFEVYLRTGGLFDAYKSASLIDQGQLLSQYTSSKAFGSLRFFSIMIAFALWNKSKLIAHQCIYNFFTNTLSFVSQCNAFILYFTMYNILSVYIYLHVYKKKGYILDVISRVNRRSSNKKWLRGEERGGKKERERDHIVFYISLCF